ncbi:MAG TPA: peptidoglycan-binding protein [Xanthobacteraceae bacterium]|nr:peptidoglycan-binding protein [Xanthobacteraceae bacterium]
MRVVAVMAGLTMAASPPFARDCALAKPIAAAHRVAQRPAKQQRASGATRGHPSAAVANSYAAMPQAERLAIQADLAFIGDYEGAAGGDFDETTIAAIKAFQTRNHGRATGILDPSERDALAAAAKAPEDAVGWRLTEDPTTGARLGLPEKLVPRVGSSRTGGRWTSAQGQIQIETFRYSEAALPALFEEEKKTAKRRVAASVLKPDSFVISGVQGLKNFVVRAQASGSELRGITILYDQATEGIMAPVAVATANGFEGFPNADAGPPRGLRRSVEYGTAIVVGARGDLIASAQATDGCQSITVPGFGHAERVAADKINDLALIRLYGARNLVSAALAGETSTSDELALVGIADPLTQAGDAAVTRAAGRLTAQGIRPAPRPGFSGAAALDAQGRFAGMVDLQSPVVAGAGAAALRAALIPADAVRAFLQAQGITPAASAGDPAAIDQSVLRVICVRR